MSRMHLSSPAPSVRPGARRGPGRLVVAVALAGALLLAGCGSDEELGGKVVEDGLGCTLSQVDRSTEEAPTVEPGTEVGDEVATEDLVEPEEEACTAGPGTYLTLDLVGATAADGKPFNDTFGQERPVTAQLGVGQLIAGLETGLEGMQVGARRQITVPAEFGYGAEGNEAQGIGADADLVFIVDLVAITDTPLFCNEAAPIAPGQEGKPTEVAMPLEPPVDEVVTTVLTEGDGPEASAASYVTVNYLGISCASGAEFDSSWAEGGEPITVALSEAEPTATAFPVIPGWTEGMEGQKQGATIQIDIPFEDAYGVAGRPPSIGPSDPLTFIVEILEVSDEAPPDPAAESTTTVPAEGQGDTTTTTAAEGDETTTTTAAEG